MRPLAALFILIPGLLFLLLAFRGCADDAAIAASRRGSSYEESTARAYGGVTPDRAEEQGRLLLAGCEALLGIGLLGGAATISGSGKKRERTRGAEMPGRLQGERFAEPGKQPANSQANKAQVPAVGGASVERNGRAGIEEIRRVARVRLGVGRD